MSGMTAGRMAVAVLLTAAAHGQAGSGQDGNNQGKSKLAAVVQSRGVRRRHRWRLIWSGCGRTHR